MRKIAVRFVIINVLPMLLALAGCGGAGHGNSGSGHDNHGISPRNLRTGDLVFVGIPADYGSGDRKDGSASETGTDGNRGDGGSMGEAISSSTGKGSLNLIHVAVAEAGKDGIWIVDATMKRGVSRHPIDTFFVDFRLRNGSYPTFLVKRLRRPRRAKEYVGNAKSFVGQPYDVHFLPDNGAMYCSELVRESYRHSSGPYLFSDKPMNFKDKDGNFPVYWQKLFARLGEPIPQDVPGTNPQDMSEASCLRPVGELIPD